MSKQNKCYKKQDNICVRIGHQTKSDLTALAHANEMNVAEYVRYLIRKDIEMNYDLIQEELLKGVSKDTTADI